MGQVPENLPEFLVRPSKSPGGGGPKGEVGEGVFRLLPTGLWGSLGGRQGNQWALVYPAADRLPTSRWGCFRGYLKR